MKDKKPVEDLALFLGYPKNRVKQYRKNIYELHINCKKLFMDLVNNGLMPNKVHILDGVIVPEKYKWDFIRGLFDADGSLYLSRIESDKALDAKLSFSGNYPLLKEIQNIIASNISDMLIWQRVGT